MMTDTAKREIYGYLGMLELLDQIVGQYKDPTLVRSAV